jgi:uncharacterized membrane protein YfcA
MDPEAYVVIFVAIAVGSFGKALTGFGLPLIAIPVMASVIGVETAVVTMVLPSTVSNIWLVWTHRRQAKAIQGLWPTLVAGACGIFAGTWILSALDERALSLILAGWIAVYLLSLLVRGGVHIPMAKGKYLSPPVVLVAGGVQGATGIAGPIVAPFFHAFRLEPPAYVFVISVVFLVFGFSQFAAMSTLGLFTMDRIIGGLIALVPVVIATPLGIRLSRTISRRAFDICIILILLGMGTLLIWRAFS